MKKLLSMLAVLFVLGTVNVFALGIGPQGGYTVNGAPSGALTFKVASAPCVFAVNADFGDTVAIGLTADWWIANPKIEGTWGYYYGVGLAGSINVGNNNALFVGGRALLGTNVFLINKFIELYLQAAWQPGINIDNGIHPTFSQVPLNVGLRFWF
ncbi:MAG: hypothetical protein K5907_00445 [Treponema sp.]|nr:hypothetical protein [Treponema sp.]